MLYKFFLRSAYNKEKALVESMKDDLKNSYHLTDNEISQIENSRKELNDKKLDEDAKIIDKDIRIDTTNNKRVESDEYAKEENDLLNDVSENKFYEDLAVAVNENIYQRTSEFVDGKKTSSPKKDLDK